MCYQKVSINRDLSLSPEMVNKWLLFDEQRQLLIMTYSIYWPILYADLLVRNKVLVCQVLGRFDGEIFGMAQVSGWSRKHQAIKLSECFAGLSDAERTLTGYASQLLVWCCQVRYCQQCAGLLERIDYEYGKYCAICNLTYYPRIDPCIMALIYADERLLLVRAKRHKKGLYSTVAGFIESGEMAEQAVAREVMEEVGVRVHKPQYIASQSWPFPHALMLGFFAQYHSGDLSIDDNELEHGQWFHKDRLPLLPPNTPYLES